MGGVYSSVRHFVSLTEVSALIICRSYLLVNVAALVVWYKRQHIVSVTITVLFMVMVSVKTKVVKK